MKHYKDSSNNLFGLDTEDIPDGYIEITLEEARAIAKEREVKQTPACTPRQIRQVLTAVGLRAAVEAAVAAGSQDLRDWWEFSTVIERTHPEVIAMGAALGQTPEQLDQLFVTGATL